MMIEQKCKQYKATSMQTCTVRVPAGKKCMLARTLCDTGSEKGLVKNLWCLS